MQYVLMLPPGTAPWDREALPRHYENSLVLYHALPSIHAMCAWCGHHVSPEQVMNLYVPSDFFDIMIRYGKSQHITRTQSFWEQHATPIFFSSPAIVRGHVSCIVNFFAQWTGTSVHEIVTVLKRIFSLPATEKLQFVYHFLQYLSTPEFSLADCRFSSRYISSEKDRLSTHIARELTQYLDSDIIPTSQQDFIWRFLLSKFLNISCIYQDSKPSIREFVIPIFDEFDEVNTKQYLKKVKCEHFRTSQDFFKYVEDMLRKTYACFTTRYIYCYWTACSPPPLFKEEDYHGSVIA